QPAPPRNQPGSRRPPARPVVQERVDPNGSALRLLTNSGTDTAPGRPAAVPLPATPQSRSLPGHAGHLAGHKLSTRVLHPVNSQVNGCILNLTPRSAYLRWA